jgi:hypothetical protein
MPVTEELQIGVSTGLALAGHIPVTIFPRWNFLLLAVNQVVNHLDKLSLMSNWRFRPKVIIRTGIGSERPLHPRTSSLATSRIAFRLMCKNIEVIRLMKLLISFRRTQKLFDAKTERALLLFEYGDYYNQK